MIILPDVKRRKILKTEHMQPHFLREPHFGLDGVVFSTSKQLALEPLFGGLCYSVPAGLMIFESSPRYFVIGDQGSVVFKIINRMNLKETFTEVDEEMMPTMFEKKYAVEECSSSGEDADSNVAANGMNNNVAISDMKNKSKANDIKDIKNAKDRHGAEEAQNAENLRGNNNQCTATPSHKAGNAANNSSEKTCDNSRDAFTKLKNQKQARICIPEPVHKVIIHGDQILFRGAIAIYIYTPFSTSLISIPSTDLFLSHFLYILSPSKITVYGERLVREIPLNKPCERIAVVGGCIFLAQGIMLYKTVGDECVFHHQFQYAISDMLCDEHNLYVLLARRQLAILGIHDNSIRTIAINIHDGRLHLNDEYIVVNSATNGYLYFKKDDPAVFHSELSDSTYRGFSCYGRTMSYISNADIITHTNNRRANKDRSSSTSEIADNGMMEDEGMVIGRPAIGDGGGKMPQAAALRGKNGRFAKSRRDGHVSRLRKEASRGSPFEDLLALCCRSTDDSFNKELQDIIDRDLEDEGANSQNSDGSAMPQDGDASAAPKGVPPQKGVDDFFAMHSTLEEPCSDDSSERLVYFPEKNESPEVEAYLGDIFAECKARHGRKRLAGATASKKTAQITGITNPPTPVFFTLVKHDGDMIVTKYNRCRSRYYKSNFFIENFQDWFEERYDPSPGPAVDQSYPTHDFVEQKVQEMLAKQKGVRKEPKPAVAKKVTASIRRKNAGF